MQLEPFEQLEARALADLRRFRDTVAAHAETRGLSLDHRHDLAALAAKVSPGVVVDVCTALDSGRQDQVEVRIAAEFQSIRRTMPDAWMPAPLKGYLARLMLTAGTLKDAGSVRAAADSMTVDVARRLQFALRAKLRAEGRPVPDPRTDDRPVAQSGRRARANEHHEHHMARKSAATEQGD